MSGDGAIDFGGCDDHRNQKDSRFHDMLMTVIFLSSEKDFLANVWSFFKRNIQNDFIGSI